MTSTASDKPIAVVDDARFDLHEERGGDHPECPERLTAAREGLYGAIQVAQRTTIAAREATEAELGRIHRPAYVRRLREQLSHRDNGNLDPDTYYSPGSRDAAWLAAGSGIDLAQTILRGGSDRGFALVRPPGHHAVPDRSMGFCLLNNVALSASAALAAGLSRVAIVDWDVHHGNGTQDAFYDDPRVLMISLHQFPFYPGTGSPAEVGRGAGTGTTANLALPSGGGPGVYGAAFREVVLPLLRAHAPELVLVSAGFDAHTRDPLASMQLPNEAYGAMASSLLDLVDARGHRRIAFMLEGGYDLLALKESVSEVGKAILGHRTELPDEPLRASERAAIDATKHYLAPYARFDEA